VSDSEELKNDDDEEDDDNVGENHDFGSLILEVI
jgi:hypothetical protein